jgi:hypothetical protein
MGRPPVAAGGGWPSGLSIRRLKKPCLFPLSFDVVMFQPFAVEKSTNMNSLDASMKIASPTIRSAQ